MFRPEAIEAAKGTSLGEPLVQHWRGVAIFCSIAVCLTTLIALVVCFAEFAPSFRVPASLNTSSGTAIVRSEIEGRVAEVLVLDGVSVTAGDAIISLDTDAGLVGGGSRRVLSATTLRDERVAIADRLKALDLEHQASVALRQRTARSLREQIEQVEAGLHIGQRIVATLRDQVARSEGLAQGGFVSPAYLGQMQADLGTQEMKVASLNAEVAGLKRELAQLVEEDKVAAARHLGHKGELRRTMAEAERASVINEAESRRLVRATAGGRVSLTDLARGQSVVKGQQLFSIVQKDEALVARLFVPPEAMSALVVGAPISLTLKAYPAEQYGFVRGRISSISAAPQDALPGSIGGQVFFATAELETKTFPSGAQMQPGMQAEALVSPPKKPIVRWMLAPLFRSFELQRQI